jgi:hypothetical protein
MFQAAARLQRNSGHSPTFGNNITSGKYNAWNWLYNGPGNSAPFDSWGAGISRVTKGIAGPNYLGADPPLTTTSSIYAVYCSGPDCKNGLKNINTFLTQQGGNSSSLTFPCNK